MFDGGEAARWVYFVVGSLLWLYQAFDNMDGKQARRTGSSSALGELVRVCLFRSSRSALLTTFAPRRNAV